ncbi:LPXTG-motif cell wall anchor domain-containing protein/adhesin isopeptide-forming domain-containing protein, sspB-C2 type [Pilibacter termitis]|uniref:LPXTG-motif cell wall anchor domain-containing protein/adhesin isopeptide-forming domain-containing protein, sspB-C2 type n=1 Tax=Pilibacter termitis TaxID=263852 RepID=A0A1T4KS60_9ENTE|nr:LPXTG cell wall anchor domain-containing protein [Pilibacter termitis]SJZ45274.1 LPXTG-motif cell wall anchor domain-containing protein/adhesin isopeptide-forming domain-containing protein, sspB-C2 type [Pilibacter termitis]
MKKTTHNQWKRKLYVLSMLGILGGNTIAPTLPIYPTILQSVSALTVPSSMTQIGSIGSSPVLKAPTSSLKDQWFKDLTSNILNEQSPSYIVEQAQWTSNTKLEGGSPLSTFGQTANWVFQGDGYNGNDLGKVMNVGDVAKISNIGTAMEMATGKSIPISLNVKLLSANGFGAPNGGAPQALNSSLMMVKNQGSTITIGWGGEFTTGGTGGGGNENGSGGGGNTDGKSMLYIENVRYAVQLVNANTGQPLPDDTLMPIKMSDIDATQWANLDQTNALAFVVGNDTNLELNGSNFQVKSNAAFNADGDTISPTSFLALKQWNQNIISYSYNGLTDRNDIVTAIFGNLPSWDLGGFIEIDKSTLQYGKNGWNANYSFEDLAFEVIAKDGKVVDTIHLDKNGKGKSKKIPSGDYTLHETSGKWASSGQTVHPDMTAKVSAGATSTVKVENTAVQGTISIKKSLDGYSSLPNSNYKYEGLQFEIKSEDGKYTDVVTLDKNGEGKSKYLPLSKYTVKEIPSSVTSGTGQIVNPTTYTAELKYKDQNTEIVLASQNVVNTPVTGQITVDKTLAGYGKDLPNGLYSLEGLKFKLTHKETNQTCTITTDKNGVAKTATTLLLGEYDVQEIASSVTKPTGQVVNKNVYKAKLVWKDNQTKLVFAETDVANPPVLGQISIKKTGVESGENMWNQHYSLAGNVFEITPVDPTNTKWKEGTFPLQVTTNAKGEAKTPATLPLGKYLVNEIKASNGFGNTFKPVVVELTWKDNQTALVFDSATGTNQEIKGQNTLEKTDKDTGKDPHGKADMKDAEYALFYDEEATGSSPHQAGQPVKWSDIPKAKLLKGEKVTTSYINGVEVKHGDNVVISVDDKDLNLAIGNLAIGKYVWKEINAPEGYVLDKNVYRFEIKKKDDQTLNIVTPDSKSEEQIIQARITVQKLAEIVGESAESGFNGVEFTFTPINGTKGNPVVMKTGVNEATDEDGFGQVVLDYGDYVMKETKGIDGFDNVRDIYIHMTTDKKKDLLYISASNNSDFSKPFSQRTFALTDNQSGTNPNETGSVGKVSTDKFIISLGKMVFTDKVTPEPPAEPVKDVTKNDGGNSINHGDVALSSDFVYSLVSSNLSNGRNKDTSDWSILDDYDERYDQFNGTFRAYAKTNFGTFKKGDQLPSNFFTATDKDGKVNFVATKDFLKVINDNKNDTVQFEIRADFYRHKWADVVYNTFDETKNGLTEKSNEVDTKTPAPQPHKFDVEGKKVDLTGDKLLNDDDEMKDRYKDSNDNPYLDKVDNNESFNLNTKKVKPGDKITYQLWLDTNPFDNTSKLTALAMIDDFDEKLLDVDVSKVKVYNKKGEEVTKLFKSEIKDGKLIVSANVFVETTNSKGQKVQVVDTKKLPLGQFYKIEFPTVVKKDILKDDEIINTAQQVTIDANGKYFIKITEKRVNPVEVPSKPVKDVQNTDEGDSIHEGNVALSSDFIYVLNSRLLQPDRTQDTTIWTIVDDFDENFDKFDGTFRAYATAEFGDYKKGDQLPETFFTSEEKGGKVTFTATKEFLTVVNEKKDKQVGFSIHADFFRFKQSDKVLNTFVETVNDSSEKSNEVQTKTPEPQPHKFDLSKEQFDLTGKKLLDDDKEMKDRYQDSNKDPYLDKTDNNEKENLNTKEVKSGDQIIYQLWLDTIPFDETSELISLFMEDDYDEKTLDVDVSKVKVYNAKGEDVTKRFKVEDKDGKLTVSANVFVETTNSKGEKVKIVDTTLLPFGQVYKIDVPTTVKEDVKSGTEIVNTASQHWTDSDGIANAHVTEKRVNKVNEERPELPVTGEKPKKGIINILLPDTGEKQAIYLSVLGSMLVASIVFLKREELQFRVRKLRRKLRQ